MLFVVEKKQHAPLDSVVLVICASLRVVVDDAVIIIPLLAVVVEDDIEAAPREHCFTNGVDNV